MTILVGCAKPTSPEFGKQETKVPKQFRNAVGWQSHSEYQNYVDGFNKGYWKCIQNHVNDIDYKDTESDKIIIGHGSTIGGYSDGYEQAQKEIEKNISVFGKETTHQFIKEWWEGI